MCIGEDILDIFRGSFPVCLFIAFPIFFILAPLPVHASVEFPIYRLQQFDLHGFSYGSPGALVNVEARTLDSNSVSRKCVIARIISLSADIYQDIVHKGAAALLVLLPEFMTELDLEQKKLIVEIEESMIQTETQMAVYFAHETKELSEIYESVKNSGGYDQGTSAAAALFSSLSSDGYQMVSSASQSKLMQDSSISNVYGRLSGHGDEEQLSSILFVAHYDAFSAATDLSYGGDSNGSGIVALLELARIFSKLYSTARTLPKMNLVFLLSAGGYLNYQGSKRFLEDQLDGTDSPLISELNFALCLDSISKSNILNMHVSKRPKEDTPTYLFWKHLEESAKVENTKVEVIHSKINLLEEKQKWEHEKYSIRRLPAFTISSLNNSEDGSRGSLTDTFDALDVKTLASNVRVVTSSLLSHVYGLPMQEALENTLSVDENSVSAWVDLLKRQARSPQLLAGKNTQLIDFLQQTLSRYMSEARITSYKSDSRDPEWQFYEPTRSKMTAYAVKPAAFDLVLILVISAYLFVVYIFVANFGVIYCAINRLVAVNKKQKSH